MTNNGSLKERSIKLRRQGNTYLEIQKELKVKVPKSTLSYWLKDIELSEAEERRIKRKMLERARAGRRIALMVNKKKRKEHLELLWNRNKHLSVEDIDTAKIALSMLYLADGAKKGKGYLMFGNSSPFIIGLFLDLLRKCYSIDESKFRCTLQCRADQNIRKLEEFWSKLTAIPASQFYKARVDPRTIGKPSKKPNYKGVCRIDYFSADLFMELTQIPRIIYDKEGP